MQQLIRVFDYEGSPIQFEIMNGQIMMNATLAAKAFKKEPDDIFKTKSWKEYEKVLLEVKPNLNSEYLRSSKEGVNGGTWIHQELALEFARRLNPKFSIWCNDMMAELLRTGSVSIKPRKTRKQKYIEQGRDPKWIAQRTETVDTRKHFTLTLKKHGVKDEGYRNCTNAIYNPLFGGSSVVVREKIGIDKSQSIRDNLTRSQLAAINLAEQLAAEKIENENINGNAQCEIVCTRTSKAVAVAVNQALR